MTAGVPASTKVQASYPACTVRVILTGTGGQLATVYSDVNATELANPFTANGQNGSFYFWADDSYVDVQLSGAGITSPVTIPSIPLFAAGTGVTYLGTLRPAPDGTNLVFNLQQPQSFVILQRNGQTLVPGSDYILAGSTVTFFQADTPQQGDVLAAYGTNSLLYLGVPSGAIDGANVTFTVNGQPGNLLLYLNGQALYAGVNYSINNSTITLAYAPLPGDTLIAYSTAGSEYAIPVGLAGQFPYYAQNGATLTPHTLTASDLPTTGVGPYLATSPATPQTPNACTQWDVTGTQLISFSGGGCGTQPSGAANLVVATPDNASGSASLRQLVGRDLAPAAGTGLAQLNNKLVTYYNGLNAMDWCSTPMSPTQDCVSLAFGTGITNRVIVPANFTFTGALTIPPNSSIVWLGTTYATGNTGKIILSDQANMYCPNGSVGTVFSVPQTYSVTDGVIVLNATGSLGGNQTINGCGITFSQPAGATTRAAMVHYAAAAIYSPTASGWNYYDGEIIGAWNGLVISGGALNGHTNIDNLKMSSFNLGFDIDNSFDAIHISKLHWWPWGLSAGQIPAMKEVASMGINAGKSDLTIISDSFLFGGTPINAYLSSNGFPFLQISNTSTEIGGITQSAGWITWTGGTIHTVDNPYRAIDLSGTGVMNITGTQLLVGGTSSTNMHVRLQNTAVLIASTLHFYMVANDITEIGLIGDTARAIVTGSVFQRNPNINYVNPTILVQGLSQLVLADSMPSTVGSGSASLVTLTADGKSIIHDIYLLGNTINTSCGPCTNIKVHDTY